MHDVLKILCRVLRGQKILVLLAMVLTVYGCFLKLYLPGIMAEAVDHGLMCMNGSLLYAEGLRMLGVCLSIGICGYLSGFLGSVIGQCFSCGMRTEMFEQITRLSTRQVSDFGAGTLITRLSVDMDLCAQMPQALLLFLTEPLLLTVGGIVRMFRIGTAIGWAFVLFVCLQLAVMVLFIRTSAPAFMQVRESMDRMNEKLHWLMRIFRLTRLNHAEAEERARFERDNVLLYERTLTVQNLLAVLNPLVILILNLALCAVLFLAGVRVRTSNLNMGLLLAAIAYTEQVLVSLMSGGQLFRMLIEVQPSARRICEIMETQPEMQDGIEALREPFREIRFSHVSYAYPGGAKVFTDLDFTIRAGEKLVLMGAVGSGKTTLANLSVRLIDPDAGEVLLNGRDIRMWHMQDVRRMIAWVEKQPAVVDGTLEENLVFGRSNIWKEGAWCIAPGGPMTDYEQATGEKDRDACSMKKDIKQGLAVSQILDFAQNRGSDEIVRGLSGGEKQRLGIARALLGQPGLLILDDSTSALDYVTEDSILKAIHESEPGLACLLITSRECHCAGADRVLRLVNGKLYEDSERTGERHGD